MPDALPKWKLHQIAHRTLSHDDNDISPISHHYLQILLNHLEHYPQEENFLMDLEDGGGTLTCLDCLSEVLVADAQGELKGFDAFWAHIATPTHQDRASQRLNSSRTTQPRPKPSVNLASHRARTDRVISQGTLSTPPAARPRKHIMRVAQFSDGDVVEYFSSDEEGEQPTPASSLLRTPSTSSGHSSAFDASISYPSPFHASSNTGSPLPPPSSGSASPFPTANRRFSPPGASISNTSYFTGSNGHDLSFSHSEPTAYPSSSFSTASHTKRSHPRKGIRRYDYGDGDIIYLSTDDETVDERPGASPEKKPRLGGALIKNEHGITRSEHGLIKREQGYLGKQAQVGEGSRSIVEHVRDAYHAIASSIVPATPVPPPQHAYQHADQLWEDADCFAPEPQQDYGWDHEMQNDEWYADPFGAAMPGGMGYHAPPVPQADPVPDGQAAGYDYRPGAGSFNLNYDENGPMGHIDMGGPDQMQKMKDFFLSTMEDLHEAPKVVDAVRELGLPEPAALLPGLEVQLMPHQLIGVSWMVAQEAKANIRGGILADDMGLGKTVQSIATCVKNPPVEGADSRKSTLVVAPAALLEQWAAEFRERTVEGLFRVHIHHGTNKLRSVNQVRQYDVVITTYQTLCSDFPKDKKGKGKAKAADYSDSESDELNALGPLAATEWYRVVLDEAQCIRNRTTRSSRCVARLDSTYRWALTGTPVTNTLADIYGLVRFLQFRPFNDWKEFNESIAKVQKRRPDLAGQRAQALLKQCLLRRTKNTKLEGKLILQLPPKHIEVIEVEFSAEEREIYKKVEEQQRQRMSKFLQAGTVMKNYAVILVMLLRLRQVCNHPQLIATDRYDEDGHLVVEGEGDRGYEVDTSPAGELKRAEQLLGHQFVEDAKSKLREQAQARIQSEIQGTEVEEEDCPICFDTYVNNCRITSCKHLFCSDCLNDVFKNKPIGVDVQDAAYAEGVPDGSRSCPVCRTPIQPDRVFRTTAFEPSASELEAFRMATSGSIKTGEVIDLTLDDDDFSSSEDPKGKGKGRVKNEDELDDLNLDSLDKGDNFEPSAKMLKMMDFLKQWYEAAPTDKIICYSQWTSMIDLVEKLLARDKIENTRFDGRMSRIARDGALARFKRRDGPSIMLISLKCGGVGLNLVEANRVLCLDLAWNAATENQAFDRVHRMGQHKDVHVKRLIVRNTVEERILNLQAKKQSLADAALGEGKAQKIKKMSVKELKTLFGM